jgi:hypothetical protein
LRIVDDVQAFAGRVRVSSALVVALALSACQTVVVKSHRDSSVGKLTFARSLAIVNFSGYENSEPIRRAGEMELVNSLPDLNLVPSYRLFPLEELADIGEVKRRAAAEGFDGFVLLLVKEVRVERGMDAWVALPPGYLLDEGLGSTSASLRRSYRSRMTGGRGTASSREARTRARRRTSAPSSAPSFGSCDRTASWTDTSGGRCGDRTRDLLRVKQTLSR